jgi:hypothetical protein
MPLLLFQNQIVKDHSQPSRNSNCLLGHNLPSLYCRAAVKPAGLTAARQWTEADKADLIPPWNWAALPASGHSRGFSTDEPTASGARPFGGIAEYSGQ